MFFVGQFFLFKHTHICYLLISISVFSASTKLIELTEDAVAVSLFARHGVAVIVQWLPTILKPMWFSGYLMITSLNQANEYFINLIGTFSEGLDLFDSPLAGRIVQPIYYTQMPDEKFRYICQCKFLRVIRQCKYRSIKHQ